jgi:HD-GYP domain-containing protein (c-di-GMP phosphodiesterase class II)
MSNEMRKAIDLMLFAPEKVAKGYITSLLASKTIAVMESRRLQISEEATRPKEKVEAETEKEDKDDVALDPEFQKEFYLKSFEYKGKLITLKKLGMGASAPVSAYVDDKRTEIFLTPEQAEREIKKIIDMKEKVKDAKMESLENAGLDGVIVEHDDKTTTNLSFEQISEVLEIYKRLNNKNKDRFDVTFAKSSDEATEMINYFKKGLRGI